MKDYYYILGINKDSNFDEIKKAYRKLSLKFHPDKNDGDEFFTERFKEIQEAYEVLSEPKNKVKYDNDYLRKTANDTANKGYNFDPIIEYFEVNKSEIEFDEEITFNWKTINSDKVTIRPFGNVQPIGEKTYRIKNFKNPILSFELIAENTNTGRQIKQTIKLNNKTFKDLYSYFRKLIEDEKLSKDKSYSSRNKGSGNIEFFEGTPEEKFDILLGSYIKTRITFSNGQSDYIMQGKNTGKYFYLHSLNGRTYAKNKADCINQLYLHKNSKI